MELDLNSQQDYARHDQDWQGIVLHKDFLRKIDQIAERRFGSGALAEEAATYSLEYLSENQWARCQAFAGKAKTQTFLFTLVANAIEEFSRKKFGRPRPPTWLSSLGDTWVKLWRSLCLERQLLPAIIDRFCRNDFRDKQAVSDAARVIKQRIPDCGLAIKDAQAEDDLAYVIDTQYNHCDESERAQSFVEQLTLLIHQLFGDASYAGFDAGTLDSEKLRRLKEALDLNDEERLMLRMVYVDGLSKSACSRALGLPAHQVGRRLNALLERLNTIFARCDVQF